MVKRVSPAKRKAAPKAQRSMVGRLAKRQQEGTLISLGGDELYFVPNAHVFAAEITSVLNRDTLKPFAISKHSLIRLTEEVLDKALKKGITLRPFKK